MRSIRLALAATLAALPAVAQTPAACDAPTQNTSLPATIPIEFWSNHIYVKVCANGRTLDFILDTGAGATYIDMNNARAAGVKLGQTFSVGGAGAGQIGGARIDGQSLTIAGTSITQPIAEALDLSALPAREGHRMDGILGADFITRNVMAIDYAKRELRLYDRTSFTYSGSGTTLPITFSESHPNVDGEIRLANGETLKGRFVIDVGSGNSLSLTKPFVEDNKLETKIVPLVRRSGGGGVGGAIISEFGRVAGLTLGGVTLNNVVTQLVVDSGGVFAQRGSWVGNIGGDILRRFTVYFDYTGKRLILEPNEAIAEAFETDMSGLQTVLNDSLTTLRVDFVLPGSPAADAGLVRGDDIVSVDGVEAATRARALMRDRFRRSGEHVKLVIRRGGETKTVELVTRRLV
ncbi:MAG: aspartyl protease family protein [bacterium]